jgi:acetamidase/formamidase
VSGARSSTQSLTLSNRLTGLADRSVNQLDILKVPLAHDILGNNDSADDMKNVDLTRIHYLSGPFEIETAEPGDVLLVEIMDVQPFEDAPWGL